MSTISSVETKVGARAGILFDSMVKDRVREGEFKHERPKTARGYRAMKDGGKDQRKI
jgi:hypothetical protein